jgi:hypothetical protein
MRVHFAILGPYTFLQYVYFLEKPSHSTQYTSTPVQHSMSPESRAVLK